MIEKFIPKLRKKDILILLLLTAVYFLLTTNNLTGLPVFVDEAIYSRWAQVALNDAQWRFISLTDGKQPLFIWTAMPFLKYISDPLFATRLVSVFSGYFTMLGVWYAGWLISDKSKKTAYIASVLSIISPYLFFYNRFAVMEAMLIAFGIWIFNLTYLLVKTIRLDIALILGMTTGMGLLVKSPAKFFFFLIPITYYLVLAKNKLFSKKTRNFIILVLISWAIAQAFYYIQRLSPWMYRIPQKNEFFLVPLSQIFEEPKRIFLHLKLALKWYSYYNTLPLFLTGLIGIYLMLKEKTKLALVLLAWFLGPIIAEAFIARLFSPRYIVFVQQFFLLFIAYALSQLKKKHLILASILLAIIPTRHITKSIRQPLEYPFIAEDSDYIDGWSHGRGLKEIAEYLESRANQQDKKVFVGTEGTFGLLPHGLKLYTNNTENLEVQGYWPVEKTPPDEIYQKTQDQDLEVYFIYNNTQLENPPKNTKVIMKIKRKTDNYLQLYKLEPQVLNAEEAN